MFAIVSPVRQWIVTAVFLAFGLGCIYLGIGRRSDVARMADYQSTTGTITLSRAESEMGGRRGLTPGFETHVEYEYVVDGTTHTGDHIDLSGGSWSSNEDEVRTRLASYPVGGTVTVYYDPASPDGAVLERADAAHGTLGAMLVGGFFTLLGLLGVVGGVMRRLRAG